MHLCISSALYNESGGSHTPRRKDLLQTGAVARVHGSVRYDSNLLSEVLLRTFHYAESGTPLTLALPGT